VEAVAVAAAADAADARVVVAVAVTASEEPLGLLGACPSALVGTARGLFVGEGEGCLGVCLGFGGVARVASARVVVGDLGL
jgi:hypothetical protein